MRSASPAQPQNSYPGTHQTLSFQRRNEESDSSFSWLVSSDYQLQVAVHAKLSGGQSPRVPRLSTSHTTQRCSVAFFIYARRFYLAEFKITQFNVSLFTAEERWKNETVPKRVILIDIHAKIISFFAESWPLLQTVLVQYSSLSCFNFLYCTLSPAASVGHVAGRLWGDQYALQEVANEGDKRKRLQDEMRWERWS